MQLYTKNNAIKGGYILSSQLICEERIAIKIYPNLSMNIKKPQNELDEKILNLIKFFRIQNHTKINSKYISKKLGIPHNQVITSISRLNQKGFKIKKLND